MSKIEGKIIFKNLKGFPKLNETNNIETVLFLEAAKEVVSIIESFGTIFSPVVSDMNGNIEKLNKSYQKNIEKYRYLKQFIQETHYKKNDYTGSSLLWLKRALELISAFFYNIFNDQKLNENLQNHFKNAYDATLKKHHGWFIQTTFSLIYNWVPTRSQLIGVGDLHNENIQIMSTFLPLMQNNIKQIDLLLISLNINK